jgi:hypothetical protein
VLALISLFFYTLSQNTADRFIQFLTAIDPNEIVGPAGGGDAGWSQLRGPLAYAVYFEVS